MNSMMKIAIIGASGLLGRALFHEFEQDKKFTIIGTSLNSSRDKYLALDLLDRVGLAEFIINQRPNIIILTAAEKNPKICEKNPSLAKAMNVEATKITAEMAKKIGAWLIYISTDYVFDGQNPPYLPTAIPHPLNAYGISKMEGENAIWRITEDACVLRLPLLYGSILSWHDSAVTILVNEMQNKLEDVLLIDDWAIRYPTHTADVAVVCKQIVEHKMKHSDFKGTFHWSADEPFTKYQMALIMAEYLQIKTKNILPQARKTDEVLRPYDCHLNTTSLEKLGIGKKTNFRAGIQSVIADHLSKFSHKLNEDK